MADLGTGSQPEMVYPSVEAVAEKLIGADDEMDDNDLPANVPKNGTRAEERADEDLVTDILSGGFELSGKGSTNRGAVGERAPPPEVTGAGNRIGDDDETEDDDEL